MCSGYYQHIYKNQPTAERLHKSWQLHRGPGSNSNRNRRRTTRWEHQPYHTKEEAHKNDHGCAAANKITPGKDDMVPNLCNGEGEGEQVEGDDRGGK